jgi:hypothetical protein
MARFAPKNIDRTGGLLEVSPYEADGLAIIGRDPKLIPADAFFEAGVDLLPMPKAIRAKCLDCCGGSPAEVRKCVSVKCALWPMRMGKFPAHLRAAMKADAAEEEDS